MSNLDIKFFKDTKGGKRLGGGYITSGGLKTNFSVWDSAKSKFGFNLSLPYRKNETDNSIVNEVQFTTQAISEEAHRFIAAQLGRQVEGEGSHKVVTEAMAPTRAETSTVDVKANVKRFGKAAPF